MQALETPTHILSLSVRNEIGLHLHEMPSPLVEKCLRMQKGPFYITKIISCFQRNYLFLWFMTNRRSLTRHILYSIQ